MGKNSTGKEKTSTKKRSGLIWALCLSLFWGGYGENPARAEFVKIDREKLYGLPSTNEDVILTFIKTAGVLKPEFNQLITKSDKYIRAAELEKTIILDDETIRLSQKYAALNPKKDGLLLRVPVKVNFQNNPGGQSTLEIDFMAGELTYFPFYYGGMPVAVLVDGIENFKMIYLSEEERNMVASVIDPVPEATLVLDLQPVAADFKNPVILDGAKQLPLLTRINYIGLHNRSSDQFWAWASDEEKNKIKENDLQNLAPNKVDNTLDDNPLGLR